MSEFTKFKATDEQLKQIAVNAINHSEPMGLGILHFENKNYKPDDIQLYEDADYPVNIDYFKGRMVKLTIYKEEGKDCYKMYSKFQRDYQSFEYEFPSADALLKSVEGVEILED